MIDIQLVIVYNTCIFLCFSNYTVSYRSRSILFVENSNLLFLLHLFLILKSIFRIFRLSTGWSKINRSRGMVLDKL